MGEPRGLQDHIQTAFKRTREAVKDLVLTEQTDSLILTKDS